MCDVKVERLVQLSHTAPSLMQQFVACRCVEKDRRIADLERDGAKLQGLNQQLAARVAELEKPQEAGKAPACECPTRKALEVALHHLSYAPYGSKVVSELKPALSAPCPCVKRSECSYCGGTRRVNRSERTPGGHEINTQDECPVCAEEAESQRLRARVETLETTLATAAGPIEVIGSEIRRSGTAYPQMSLELQASVLLAQDTLRAALKEGQ